MEWGSDGVVESWNVGVLQHSAARRLAQGSDAATQGLPGGAVIRGRF